LLGRAWFIAISMSYLYKENVSPRDSFERFTFVLDSGLEATLVRGHVYDITPAEVARASQFIVLVDSNFAPDQPSVTGGSGSPYWKAPVAALVNLPEENNLLGEVRLVRGEGALYWWDGSSWSAIAGSAGGDYINVTTDNALITGDMLVWNGTIFATEAP